MKPHNQKTVCVQGLGFVGAAMAVAVALALDARGVPAYDVIGIDLPTESGYQRISAINEGTFPFPTRDQKLLNAIAQVHRQGNLCATADESVYVTADIVLVDIHFDVDYLHPAPQLQFDGFKNALRAIAERISPGGLVIIETTVPPGTCEKIVIPVFADVLRRRGLPETSVLFAHAFERVMPGDAYLDSITNFWRVFAGYTKEAADACEAFLSSVVNVTDYPLTRLTSMTASETAKVMENTYRAVNIAFLDEWTRYAESVGIDMFEVVNAIRVRPTHANIRFPGLGVGGYCLTKDPVFAPAAVSQLFGFQLDFPFSQMAVRINHRMPLHTVNRLASMLDHTLKGKKILICGVGYRPNVGDTRNTPSELLARELTNQHALISVHDPYVNDWEEMNLRPLQHLPAAADLDACVLAVAHACYQEFDFDTWAEGSSIVMLDANGVLSQAQRLAIRQKGIRVESIGRGAGL